MRKTVSYFLREDKDEKEVRKTDTFRERKKMRKK